MKKKIIRLTENDLHNIINEAVKRVINEFGETDAGQKMLARLAAKNEYNGDGSYFDVSDYAKTKRNGDLRKQNLYDKAFHNEKDRLKDVKEDLSWIDRMVQARWKRFDNSKLRVIFDNLGLKRGDKGFSLTGDSGYQSFKLYNPNVEFREYDNGNVYVFFGYDDNVGAWGGYTRKYEVKDPSIFNRRNWFNIIKKDSVSTSPDVIMIK